MNRISLTICCVALSLLSNIAAAQTDREVEAHKMVLDLAGAFSNEGFKMRDGHWTGPLKQKENALVVAGAYRRSKVSRWFKPSMAEHLIKNIKLPIYIAHNK